TIFDQVYRNLGGKEDYEPSTISAPSITTDDAFSRWEIQNRLRKKILNKYSGIVREGRFRSVGFPPEDYGGYLHLRSMLGGPIRRIIDQVRMIKNDMDVNFKVEAGQIDLPEAIQVIASQTQRSDIFTREDPLRKNEAWNILIDMSSSISGMIGEAKSYATCLAEVAAVALAEVTAALSGNMEQWGMYGFSDKFYIIKDFDERYSSIVKARIGGIKPRGLTYLPDAIKIATNIIRASSMNEHNFLVVVSDGLPAGYNGIEADLTEALDKAEREGILTLAVGLNTKSIKRFFKHYCTISSPADLVKSYLRAYMELSSFA
ncbi:MAG: VWA domain-containing protein, partial [Nitrososphaerales archaeon]